MGAFEVTVLAIAALATSTISAILGMAGGISLLAVMTLILPSASIVPIHGVVQLASNFTRTIAFLKHVYWPIVFRFMVPAAVGMSLSAWMWSGDKLSWFKPAIGVFILVFLYWRRHKPKLRNLPLWVYMPLGLFAGFLAIWVGATGPFLAPFFLRDDFSKENVIATKAITQSWLHFLKLPAFLSLGFDYTADIPLLAVLLVCVVVGTHLGKRILEKIDEASFILYFEIVLGLIGLYLIVAPLFK